ncbi:hypothetical protein [Sphingobacterium sp. FBM7-1]|uniref:hypothetical protein n=1 Tax=Sphingobacterium sp. FBM7-1 TaxID=2886688 RepID=UPI001D11E160|nr:hypothetical protein [Sphingobacterium sp. FBM7-1]MCC2600009.1 hypothetical protein [Sphingobacterium sp. FBM7-1]
MSIHMSCQGRSAYERSNSYIKSPNNNIVTVPEKYDDDLLDGTQKTTQAELRASNDKPEVNQENRVSIGLTKDRVNINDFGAIGSGKDETTQIQRALNAAVGKTLYIPKQTGSYYLSRQLIVPSNINIICDKGVVFKATDDLNQDFRRFEVLFRFEGSRNVSFDGNGAKFYMNKKFYNKEFNHLFMVNGATNIVLKNIVAENSGGDGFYIGAVRTKQLFSKDIRILNCVSRYNRRQGLSITSAVNFYAENCEFSYTSGTLPEAGVDVEPGLPTAVLSKIRFKDCVAKGNKGRGFSVILIKNDASTDPVDITFENCRAIDNNVGFSNRYFSEESKGIVRFIDCISENSEEAGFWEGSCAASGAAKEYIRCIATNSHVGKTTTDRLGQYAAFRISNFDKRKKKVLGNSTFIDCEAINNGRQSRMDYGLSAVENATFQNVEIKNFVSKGHGKEALNIDIKGGRTKAGILVTQ